MDKWVPYVLVGALGLGLLVILGWVGVRGLTKLTEAEPYTAPAAADPVPASPILVGLPGALALDPPPRYRVALPHSLQEHRALGHLYPPPRHVAAWLSGGHSGMRRELLDAAAAAARAGVGPEELREMFGESLAAEPSPTHCAWLREVLSARPVTPVAEALWAGLVRCDGPSEAVFFEESDVPPEALLWWYDAHLLSLDNPWNPRVEAAALQLTRQSPEWAPVAARLVVALEPDKRAQVMERLAESGRDRRLLQAVQDLVPQSPEGAATGSRDFDALLANGAEPQILAARAGDQAPQLARALVRCAVGNDSTFLAAECLGVLAHVDRTMATQAAHAILASDPSPGQLREVGVALTQFSSGEALLDSMRASGLLGPADGPADGAAHAASARDILVGSGRATCFDTETGTVPAGHDSTMQRLAFLATPALDDVIFEETPPVVDDAGQSFGGYNIHAYMDGSRYTLPATDYGDWLDVNAMVSLLNALLVQRGSAVRIAWLASEDQWTCLVAGTESGLLAAEATGLITLAQPEVDEPEPVADPADFQRLIESIGEQGGGY